VVNVKLKDIKVNKVNNEVKIEIVSDEIKKDIAEEYFLDFLNNRNIESLENAITIDKDYVKNFIIKVVRRNISKNYIDGDFCFNLLENLDIIEKVFEINIKEYIKNTIKDVELELKPQLLIKVFEKFEYSKESIKEIMEKLMVFYNWIYYLVELKKLYPQLASLILNEHIDNILKHLEYYLEDLQIGRGCYFDYAKNFFLELSELKDLLNDKNMKKIQNFLLSNDIESLISRRIENKSHIDYIKAILSFLPDEIKGKYVAYFL
jgi:hypothetical protein